MRKVACAILLMLGVSVTSCRPAYDLTFHRERVIRTYVNGNHLYVLTELDKIEKFSMKNKTRCSFVVEGDSLVYDNNDNVVDAVISEASYEDMLW